MTPALGSRPPPRRVSGLLKMFRDETMKNSRGLPHDLPTPNRSTAPTDHSRAPDSAPVVPTGDVAWADWPVLFEAVTSRLRQLATLSGPADSESLATLQRQVLDCVTALEQLARSLAHERERSTPESVRRSPRR